MLPLDGVVWPVLASWSMNCGIRQRIYQFSSHCVHEHLFFVLVLCHVMAEASLRLHYITVTFHLLSRASWTAESRPCWLCCSPERLRPCQVNTTQTNTMLSCRGFCGKLSQKTERVCRPFVWKRTIFWAGILWFRTCLGKNCISLVHHFTCLSLFSWFTITFDALSFITF